MRMSFLCWYMYIGGGLGVNQANEDISISGCHFQNNSAVRAGALFFFQSNANIALSNSSFLSNRAANSVGVVDFSFSNEEIAVIGCEFLNNYGADNTGVMRFFSGNMNVEVTGCIFRENIAKVGAGAILIRNENSNFQFSGNIFEKNSVTEAGIFLFLQELLVSFCILMMLFHCARWSWRCSGGE